MRRPSFRTLLGAALGLLVAAGCVRSGLGPGPAARSADERHYWVYVANESSDVVSRVRYGPGGAQYEKSIDVGMIPAGLDGAHGLSVSPDGRHWYLTTAHGTPAGILWKYRTGSDVLVDSARLGLFPATIALSPDGARAFVVNFNLHGDPVPSTVSAVQTEPAVAELERIPTCVQPHGSRFDPEGRRHYSVCVQDDLLVEIDAESLSVSRLMSVRPGAEGPVREETPLSRSGSPGCKPTWAEPGVEGRFVYVPCNGGSEVLEIDREELTVARRFATGRAPYNLEVTRDGRYLLATNKGAASVSIIDLREGREVARVATSRPVTHGIVASPDSRYAFVSNEARGSVRSTVDVIDLRRRSRVASVEVEHQAGGIDFWKTETVRGIREPRLAPPGPSGR